MRISTLVTAAAVVFGAHNAQAQDAVEKAVVAKQSPCPNPRYQKIADKVGKCLFSGEEGGEDYVVANGRKSIITSYWQNGETIAHDKETLIAPPPKMILSSYLKGCRNTFYQAVDPVTGACNHSGPEGTMDARQVNGRLHVTRSYWKDGVVADGGPVHR